MRVIKHECDGGYARVANQILTDRSLKMIDRGMLATITGLPDSWDFSISGLCKVVPEGKDAIRASIKRLDDMGYLRYTQQRSKGRFVYQLEVFPAGDANLSDVDVISMADKKAIIDDAEHGVLNDAEKPTRKNRDGKTVLDDPTQYQILKSKTQYTRSIIQSSYMDDDCREGYRRLIADNIALNDLHESVFLSDYDKEMLDVIYGVMCEVVCYTKPEIEIKGVSHPGEVVKGKLLKLTRDNIINILNALRDVDKITDRCAYLTSALYMESLSIGDGIHRQDDEEHDLLHITVDLNDEEDTDYGSI